MACGVSGLFIFVVLTLPFSIGIKSEVCVSQGTRFPPFSSEGKLPKRVSKGPKDLTLCRVFRKKTCCDVAQTHPAFVTIRKLSSMGEATEECLQLWELLECSICDPRIGVRPGPPLLCASLCDKVFHACSNAYFSMDAKLQVLAPCGANDFVCGRASEWASNGTELCRSAGFAVKSMDNMYGVTREIFCYGGKASLDSISDSWTASKPLVTQKNNAVGLLDDFEQWLNGMGFSELVSWAVGGLVLTAGLLFISKRKSYSHRQKLAAIQRTARRLEMKSAQKSSVSPGNVRR